MKNARFFLLASLFVSASFPAGAAESSVSLNGEVSFELRNDWAFDAPAGSEVNTLDAKIEPALVLTLPHGFSVESVLVLEPVQATDPGEDTEFENEGIFIEELKLSYGNEKFGVSVGKFNPAFGTAWDLAPGMYGDDFADDYELTERIGGAGHVIWEGGETGKHTLSASLFFADTTFLSESTLTKRGLTKLDDGGISNTEDLSSYTLTLDSENMAGIAGLGTHVGFSHQQPGDADIGFSDEKAYVAGAYYGFSPTERAEAHLLVEGVRIDDVGGTSDEASYFTLGADILFDGRWSFGTSYTFRSTDVAGAGDIDDHLAQLTAGYAFENGVSVDMGYSTREVSGADTQSLGLRAAYKYAF